MEHRIIVDVRDLTTLRAKLKNGEVLEISGKTGADLFQLLSVHLFRELDDRTSGLRELNKLCDALDWLQAKDCPVKLSFSLPVDDPGIAPQ